MLTIELLVFGSAFLIALFLVGRFTESRRTVGERLAYYARPAGHAASASGRWRGMAAADDLVGGAKIARPIELLLDQSDLPIKPVEFFAIAAISGMALGVIGLLLNISGGPAAKALLVIAMVALGALIPLFWVRARRSTRRRAFARQLPDAFQTISGALRAGFGLTQGMTIVATDLPAPVSVEFSRALREMNLGSTVEDVLQNTGRRMQSVDFDLAVAGMLINRQVGGNLAELLDNVAATLRDRVRLRALIRVLTAQHRFSAWIIVAVPPVVLLVLFLGLREYTNYLLMTRIGQLMLAISLCMQLLGGYFIRRIVSFDV